MSKVLVPGGAGFIQHHLRAYQSMRGEHGYV